MEFNIDLEQAYAKAFGVKFPIYVPVTVPVTGQPKDYTQPQANKTEPLEFQNISTLKIDTSSVKSSLGTIVLSPITFRGGSYKERLKNGQIVTSQYDEFMLPATATVQVQFHKNIITTPLRGGRGEFKEMIGTSDPKVTIRGILIGEDLKRPEQEIRKLNALKEVPSELAVICDYLGWLGIDYLVIQDLKLPDLKGKPNMQPFELSCLGDKPIELILNGN